MDEDGRPSRPRTWRAGRRELLIGAAASVLDAACTCACPRHPIRTVRSGKDNTWPVQKKHSTRCGVSAHADTPTTSRTTLYAFDEILHATPRTYREPCSEKELATYLGSITRGRVTIRGGGRSLDAQSLNDDVVIHLGKHFSTIGPPLQDHRGFYITVGAGARWWDVLEKVAPYGLIPPSLVTSGDATVGGTLAAGCLSRMSCTTGKEGDQIRSFHIVLADGSCVDCSREDACEDRRKLFMAVIGGFGYLGAVTEVTFDLMPCRGFPAPGSLGKKPVVVTRSTRHGGNVDWKRLLQTLYSGARVNRQIYLSQRDRCMQGTAPWSTEAPARPALSIASFLNGDGISANFLEQGFADSQPLRRAPGGIYNKDSNFAAHAEQLAVYSTLLEFALELGFPEGEFVDELFGWAFFLGNSLERAKADARRCNERFNVTQQSFALPCGDGPICDSRPTRRFIELLLGRLHRADLRPFDIDLLYIPADTYLLSASRGLPSFVLTIAFSGMNQVTRPAELIDLLSNASRDCRALGGRVHLVKNVIADVSDLRAMYGDAAVELQRLKDTYDPNGILRNDFFDRVFAA